MDKTALSDDAIAQECARVLERRYVALKRENGGWKEVTESIDNVVSTAMVWKVANGVGRSNKVAQALGIPTQRRCKANGWLRRAVWIHEDSLENFNQWLAREGCKNLQELVDKCVQI